MAHLAEKHPELFSIKIAMLDSGVGGLSLLSEIAGWIDPDEWMYIAHNRYGQFGNKSLDEILRCLREVIVRLLSMGVRHLILVCNTACCAATLGGLETEFPGLRISYVLEAGARAAVRHGARRVGVLATQFTTDSGAYPRAIAWYARGAGIEVFPRALPTLARLIDEGLRDSVEVADLLADACREMRARSIDTLILGCTHYAFCASILQRMLGPEVRIIDPARALALELTPGSVTDPGLSRSGSASMRFYASGDPLPFSREASRLLGHPILATVLPASS